MEQTEGIKLEEIKEVMRETDFYAAKNQVAMMIKIFKGFQHLEEILEKAGLAQQFIKERGDIIAKLNQEMNALIERKKRFQFETEQMEKSWEQFEQIKAQIQKAQSELSEIEKQIEDRKADLVEVENKIVAAKIRFNKLSEIYKRLEG